ncbi:hypothetical protein NRS07_19220 (plasmid) [Massilia sp. H6]|nr:hypothetical protein [Massilia sp. H6]UVW30611.1 hypothetical protein NRS07_19220 [Massilia sp. H6]
MVAHRLYSGLLEPRIPNRIPLGIVRAVVQLNHNDDRAGGIADHVVGALLGYPETVGMRGFLVGACCLD